MIERLWQLPGKARNPRRIGGILGAGVLLLASGCNGTVTANRAPLNECGPQPYSQKGDATLSSLGGRAVIASAEQDVIILQHRTLASGGSMKLGGPDGTLTANEHELQLHIPRNDVLGDTDTVTFAATDDTAYISAGAISCSADGEVYVNGTFDILEDAVRQTTGL